MFQTLKVIDCSTVLAGPSVGTFFAELGAKVSKWEHPSTPDVTRTWKLASEDPNASVSAYFSSVNYKKEYHSINLKDSIQVIQLKEVLKSADIFLSNFKKGDAEKFGIDDDVLLSINPRLIIGKISGFGQDSDRVAYDLILQAETGYMSMNGTPDSGPVKMPVAFIDVLAAHQLKEGILTALIKRTETNKGGVVSVSLYDAAICSLANQASNFLMQGHIPQRIGSLHPNIAPYGELFETKDNAIITFAIGSDRHFQGLCDYLGLNDLSNDVKFKTNVNRVQNRTELFSVLSTQIKQLNVSDIDATMRSLFIPMGVVHNLKDVFSTKKALSLVRTEEIDSIETKRVSQIAFKYEPNNN
jgi:crotonobetainyl-CoA:carnitine CoA-transferase CaiB-like acyl-CoA transferase